MTDIDSKTSPTVAFEGLATPEKLRAAKTDRPKRSYSVRKRKKGKPQTERKSGTKSSSFDGNGRDSAFQCGRNGVHFIACTCKAKSSNRNYNPLEFGGSAGSVSQGRDNNWWKRKDVRRFTAPHGHKTRAGGYTMKDNELPAFGSENHVGGIRWVRDQARAHINGLVERKQHHYRGLKPAKPKNIKYGAKGASHHHIGRDGATLPDGDPLSRAIRDGDLHVVKMLLQAQEGLVSDSDKKKHYVNRCDHNKRSPLALAAWYGRPNIVEELLKAGADPNTQSISGTTPLHIAISRGNAKCAKLLLGACPALLEVDDKKGRKPTDCTPVVTGPRLAMHHLVHDVPQLEGKVVGELGAGNGLADNDEVFKSIAHNHHKTLEDRIAAAKKAGTLDEFLNSTDSDGNTMLHHAVWAGNDQAVKMLIKAGAKVHLPNSKGVTPFAFSCDRGNVAIMENLVDAMNEEDLQKVGNISKLVDPSSDNPDAKETTQVASRLISHRKMQIRGDKQKAKDKARIDAIHDKEASALKRKKDADARRRREAAAKLKANQDLEAKRLAAAQAAKAAKLAQRKADEAARAKHVQDNKNSLADQKNAKQLAHDEAEAKKAAEAAAAAKKREEEAEKKRLADEEKRKNAAGNADKARLEAEAAAVEKAKADVERKRLAEEAAKKRKEEAEKKRLANEEKRKNAAGNADEARLEAEAAAAEKAKADAERRRLAEELAAKKRAEEEEKRKKAVEERAAKKAAEDAEKEAWKKQKEEEAADAAKLEAERMAREEEAAATARKKAQDEADAAAAAALQAKTDREKAAHDALAHSLVDFFTMGPGQHLLAEGADRPVDADIDEMLAICGEDLGKLKGHLLAWLKMHRHFSDVAHLKAAVKVGQDTGIHADPKDKEAINQVIKSHKLMDNSDAELGGSDVDTILITAGSPDKATHHLEQYGKLNRKFKDPEALVAAIEDTTENGCHIPMSELEKLGEYFESKECTLFKGGEDDPSVVVSTQHVDELYESQRPGFCVDNIIFFDKLHAKVFSDFEELVQYIIGHDLSTEALKVNEMCSDPEFDEMFTSETDDDTLERFRPKLETCTELIDMMEGRDPAKLRPLLKKLKVVGRNFDSDEELLAAVKGAIGGDLLTPAQVKHFRYRMEPVLGKGAADVSMQQIQACLVASGNREELDNDLKAYKLLFHTFDTPEALATALAEDKQRGTHVPKELVEPFLAYMKTKGASTYKKGTPDLKQMDAVFEMQSKAPGKPWVMDTHVMDKWVNLMKQEDAFKSFGELAHILSKSSIEEIVKEGGRDQALDKIIQYYRKHHKQLFHTEFEFSYDNALKAYLTCHSQKTLLDVMDRYIKLHRSFPGSDDMVAAVAGTMDTGLHVSMDVAQDILGRLSDFFTSTNNEMELEVEDVDLIVEAGHGGSTTIKILEQMERECAQFSNMDELKAAVTKIGNGGHLYVEPLVDFFAGEGHNVFKEFPGDLTADECGKLVGATSGFASLMTHLHTFAAVGREFHTVKELCAGISAARRTGMHVQEHLGMELLEELAEADIFEGEDELDVDVDDIDHLCAAAGSIAEASRLMKVAEEDGDKHASVHDFVEAIRKKKAAIFMKLAK